MADISQITLPDGTTYDIKDPVARAAAGDAGAGKIFYGVCSTAAATQTKVVTIDDFELFTGALIAVKFDNVNTATAPKLNISGTGAINMYSVGTTAVLPNTWSAGETLLFIYNGTSYTLINDDVNKMTKGVDYVTAGRRSGTTAGSKSTAEGSDTRATASYSHAEGSATLADATAAHAEGYNTTAFSSYSHSEGYETYANGYGAHAEGHGTRANGKAQHVVGEYNTLDTGSSSSRGTYVEMVGNGTGTNSRSNARTLDWNGNEVLAGKLTLGAGPTNNMDAATKQYVDEKITYGNTDLTAGTSALATGQFYAFYE